MRTELELISADRFLGTVGACAASIGPGFELDPVILHLTFTSVCNNVFNLYCRSNCAQTEYVSNTYKPLNEAGTLFGFQSLSFISAPKHYPVVNVT